MQKILITILAMVGAYWVLTMYLPATYHVLFWAGGHAVTILSLIVATIGYISWKAK
jgi:hypothetical protein